MMLKYRGITHAFILVAARLILRPCIVVMGLIVFDDNTINVAVDSWLKNSTNATAIYGHISTWDTSLVTNMDYLFYRPGLTPFNEDISRWNTSRVTSMQQTFFSTSKFNCNLSAWDTSRVVNMGATFMAASIFNGDVSTWDTSNVEAMNQMFQYATHFNQTLCWNTSKAIKIDIFFQSPGAFSSTPYPLCLSKKLPQVNTTESTTQRPTSQLPNAPSGTDRFIKPSFLPTDRPSSTNKIWSKTWTSHTSPRYGSINGNLTPGNGTCPQGFKVVVIIAKSSNWMYQLSAKCDDKDNTRLGPWGIEIDALSSEIQSCPNGYNGWNITYGSFIGQVIFNCSQSLQYVGKGLTLGSGNADYLILKENQSIVGFQTYYNSSGIHALRIVYVDFPPRPKCYDYNGKWTDECLSKSDWLAMLWGFLTVAGIALLVGSILSYLRRRHHKYLYKKRDTILPPK